MNELHLPSSIAQRVAAQSQAEAQIQSMHMNMAGSIYAQAVGTLIADGDVETPLPKAVLSMCLDDALDAATFYLARFGINVKVNKPAKQKPVDDGPELPTIDPERYM